MSNRFRGLLCVVRGYDGIGLPAFRALIGATDDFIGADDIETVAADIALDESAPTTVSAILIIQSL